jgi:hypothetical protein
MVNPDFSAADFNKRSLSRASNVSPKTTEQRLEQLASPTRKSLFANAVAVASSSINNVNNELILRKSQEFMPAKFTPVK